MICYNVNGECDGTKTEHERKCDILIECDKCFSGTVKSLDACCIAPDITLVNQPDKNGKPLKKPFCKNCGTTTKSIKWEHPLEFKDLPLVTVDTQNKMFQERSQVLRKFFAYVKEKQERARDTMQAEFKVEYHKYLKTKDWLTRRTKALKRDNFLCQACLENKATQVHHTTYDRVFNEPLFDLVSVCDTCHNTIHNIAQSA